VPVKGGEYTEALVGTLKYINPLYAVANDVDSDLSSLVFSSIFKRSNSGELIKDLASDFKVSEDNKTYTIVIRDDVKWHNGEKLTVDDIIFTFNAIKNIQYKSPLRPSFEGVNIEKQDENTIRFVLAEPYAAFLELLSFGILPEASWLQVSPEAASLAELNLKPIGSGPYKIKSWTKDKAGNIKSYSLTLNDKYYGQQPYINNLSFKFFINFEEAVSALNENSVEGISYLPRSVKNNLVSQDSLALHKLNLPQINAIFFNQKANPALSDKKVRQALALAINGNQIINDVFAGGVRLVDGPILPDSFAYNTENKKYKFNLEAAAQLLDEAGWKIASLTNDNIDQAESEKESEEEAIKEAANIKLKLGAGDWRMKDGKYLIFSLSTVENNDNIAVAELLKSDWEKIGIKIITNIVPVNQIQSEIKRRNFEALLYGQIVGYDPDSYAFWHSSQTGENGLNITDFSNKEVDKLLEEARQTSNLEQRIEKYKKFQEIIVEELPAIFMYSPVYIYVQSKKIRGFAVENIAVPHDRFNNIADWYVKTGKRITW